MPDPATPSLFWHLAVALALGLLIGTERGWQFRELQEGRRVAGIRTYGLLGLAGGLSAVLGTRLSPLAFAVALAGVAALVIAAYLVTTRDGRDVSITGATAQGLTFLFGALAGLGQIDVAAAFAVLTTLLLGLKPVLHGWLRRITAVEMQAALKLLLLSVVLLPILPDRGYGPWQVLNPYRIWWMVVVIAGLSFAGYVAMRLVGPARGAILTALLGGLASSTAITLNFSRLARQHPRADSLLASGILAACATMFPRILIVSAIFCRPLALTLAPAIAVMAAGSYGAAVGLWLHARRRAPDPGAEPIMRNPLELGPTLFFGGLLGVILLLAKALEVWLGDAGIYLLSAVSGISDVDAITLSLAQMSNRGDLAVAPAALGVLIAAAVNTLVKAGMTWVIGNPGLGWRVTGTLLPVLALGLAVYRWAPLP